LRAQILILLILMILQCIPLSSERGSNIILSESLASLIPMLPHVKEGNVRIILTKDIERLKNIIYSYNISFSIIPKDEYNDKLLEKLDPHKLAYALLYASESLEDISVHDVLTLVNQTDEFEDKLSRGRDVSVIFYSSDGVEYSFLASYTALLKNASLLDADYNFDPSLLRNVSYVIVVTRPITKDSYQRYKHLLEILTEIDEDPYIDASFGLITGNYIETPFLMLLASESSQRPQEFIGISLIEDLPLARKVEWISSLMGIPSRIYHPDISYSNLTGDLVKSLLRGRSIIYLSLHGNPYVMALKSDSHPVITASTIRGSAIPGSIIITLSCDTLKFEDLVNPEESIAYSFLDSGALAYVGSTKVEFSVSSEFGTSYPDLILMLLMSGESLGDAVRIVNNLRIRESGGISDDRAANELLLGDPTIKLRPSDLPFGVRKGRGVYRVSILNETPTIFLRVPERGPPSINSDKPSIYSNWFEDEEGTFIYITTLSTAYAGYFSPGDNIEVKIGKSFDFMKLLPYISILVITLFTISILFKSCRDLSIFINESS